MQFHVLAVDFDGTLAHDGLVDEPTLKSLEQLRATGRKIVLVSGRRLEPLQELVSDLKIFDRIVAENGALLFNPHTGEEKILCEPTSPEFLSRLKQKGATGIEYGRVIVATWQPHEIAALEAIKDLNLELQIIINKEAVMILPTGVNKASGLQLALEEMGYSKLNVVAVGDAENDLAMLSCCGVGAAVANALDSVKTQANIVLCGARGDGVQELIKMIVDGDLKDSGFNCRNSLQLGINLDDSPMDVAFAGESILITGGPGGGKSKFAISFLDQLSEMGAQCVILDPEGDYQDLDETIVLGTADRWPAIEEVVGVLKQTTQHCVVSFFSIPKEARPSYFDGLHRSLAEHRNRTGRPHWIIVDEAHYVAPRDWAPSESWNYDDLKGVVFISAFQDRVSKTLLSSVDWIVSIAEDPIAGITEYSKTFEVSPPGIPNSPDGEMHQALAWHRGDESAFWFKRMSVRERGQRHKHSYYEGTMDKDVCFIFRGPKRALSLAADNLRVFLQMADGVDDDTWQYHLQRGDYERWFNEIIKDEELAGETNKVASNEMLSSRQSRDLIFKEIKERFEPADK